MRNALIFSAVVSFVAAPFPLAIGLFGRTVQRRRLDVDRGVELHAAENDTQADPCGGNGDMSQIKSDAALDDAAIKTA